MDLMPAPVEWLPLGADSKRESLSNKKEPRKKNNLGWLGYINGENPTQIYWDYFKKYCKGPYQHNH